MGRMDAATQRVAMGAFQRVMGGQPGIARKAQQGGCNIDRRINHA